MNKLLTSFDIALGVSAVVATAFLMSNGVDALLASVAVIIACVIIKLISVGEL